MLCKPCFKSSKWWSFRVGPEKVVGLHTLEHNNPVPMFCHKDILITYIHVLYANKDSDQDLLLCGRLRVRLEIAKSNQHFDKSFLLYALSGIVRIFRSLLNWINVCFHNRKGLCLALKVNAHSWISKPAKTSRLVNKIKLHQTPFLKSGAKIHKKIRLHNTKSRALQTSCKGTASSLQKSYYPLKYLLKLPSV